MHPERIYLIRHAHSMSNETIENLKKWHDHEIPLTEKGLQQAQNLSFFLKNHLSKLQQEMGNNFKARLWRSPFQRTRQTSEPILAECQNILHSWREDPLLIEQQFGHFDGLSKGELEKLHPEVHKFIRSKAKENGKFWTNFPLGESAAQMDMRVKLMENTFKDDMNDEKINIVLIVTHGAFFKACLRRYLNETPEFFHNEPTPPNTSIRLLTRDQTKNAWVDEGYLFTP